MKKESIINVRNFIIATRDSGYKSTASALAEIIDNAVEAGARNVILETRKRDTPDESLEFWITDDGKGMTPEELAFALQFGGSTRFNSREQLGRYGMGLPNSSLSQCRRVEVYSWRKPPEIYHCHLDVDEVIDTGQTTIHPPRKPKAIPFAQSSKSGTVVIWKKCDRLSFKYLKSLHKHLRFEMGKTFRHLIWQGLKITIDGEEVLPFDPLYRGKGLNLVGGQPYGKPLEYEIRIPGRERATSWVKLHFMELPVEEWAIMPNEEKRRHLITKKAGVSVVRSGREIDYGWFFFGEKRKENYDDWWRAEIQFSPALDECFGITHTKQEIRETEELQRILTPDMERIARELNNRVRLKFIALKKTSPKMVARHQVETADLLLPPLKGGRKSSFGLDFPGKNKGFSYRMKVSQWEGDGFLDSEIIDSQIIIYINENHLFYDMIFRKLHENSVPGSSETLRILETVLVAACRSDLALRKREERNVIEHFKSMWGANLKSILS